ncbi:MAG: DUF4388 domain-containing protein [Planctomycetota bacterium]
MAFKGDLTNISLFDVFQTLNTNQQTGVLVLQRGGSTKKIFISPEGVRIFFTRSSRAMRLGEIFVKRGRVTQQDVEILLMQQKQDYRPIGELLVESGKVSPEEMDHTLRYHAEDEIYEIFGWESGSFSFFDGETDVEHANTPLSDVLLDPGGLCLEAARRLDEMERLRETVANDEQFCVQVEGTDIDREKSSRATVAVFDALATPMSVNELRDYVGMSLFNVLGCVVQLIEGGLARGLETAELIDEARRARDASEYKRSARLYELALARDPENEDLLRECVEVLEKLDDAGRLAGKLAQLGAARAADGDHEGAVEHLEQALRHESDNIGALIELRDCFAALDDLERAAEASLRIARAHAENRDLKTTIESCREGLAISPRAIGLRFYYAQTLARTDQKVLAQAELRELVDTTREQKRALRNRKAREMLASCYRLMLRLDPDDEFASAGMKELEKQSGEKIRRRRLMVRGSIAGGILLVVAAVGIVLMPPSAASLMEQAQASLAEGDVSAARELFSRIISEHPDSPESADAQARVEAMRSSADRETALALERKLEGARNELETSIEQHSARLAKRNYAGAAAGFTEVLNKLDSSPQFKQLRSKFDGKIANKLSEVAEKTREGFRDDVSTLSRLQQRLRANAELEKHELIEIRDALAKVLQRDWTDIANKVSAMSELAAKRKVAKSAQKEIEKLVREVEPEKQERTAKLRNLGQVYQQSRGRLLKLEILAALKDTHTLGRDYLAQCEFEKARTYYKTVLKLTSAADAPDIRENNKDLVKWIQSRGIDREMQRWIDGIDEVIVGLKDVEGYKKRDRHDQAFRLMRELIREHRLVQFERRYSLPYMVSSTPKGAKVFVDDQEVGITPCAISIRMIEPTQVRIEAPGFEPVEKQLVITDPSLDGLLDVALGKVQSWETALRGTPEAAPVLAGSLVLVPTNEASLLALRTHDGGREWEATTELLDRIKARPLTDGLQAHFVTIGGRFFTVSLKNGEIVRRVTIPGEVRNDGVLMHGTVYLTTHDRKLVAVRNGEILYAKELPFVPVTALVPFGEELVVGTAEGRVLVIDPGTGKNTASFQSSDGSSFFGGVAAFGPLVVAAAEDGYLYAFDRKRKDPLWRHRLGGSIVSAPFVAGRQLFVPMRTGFAMRVESDGKKGAGLDLRNSLNSRPAVHNGFLYCAASSTFSAFDIATTRVWWSIAFEEERPLHVAAGDQAVVIVTDRGRVVAFPADKRQ